MVIAGTAAIPHQGATRPHESLGPLVLRVIGTRRHGQLVRLRSPKCTIGSSPECTLRLSAVGVRPLHCLIVRGPRATLVRCWGPDTLLNGQSFSDAELRPADRLNLGPIELEVVQTSDSTLSPQDASSADSGRSSDSSHLCERLETANRQGRHRTRRLLAELRRARREIARLESLQRQAQEVQSAAEADQLAQQRAELDARREELLTQQSRWASDRQQWEGQRQALKTERETLQERLRQSEAELEQARQEWGQEKRRFETELEQARREWEEERRQYEPEVNELRGEPSRAAGVSPVDVSKVLGRLGGVSLLPEEESGEEEVAEVAGRRPHPSPESSNAASGATSSIERRASEEEDADESIERYMARLMERVKAVASDPDQPTQVSTEPGRRAAVVVEPAAAAALPEPLEPQGPVDLSPRRAPEKADHFAAMRELASTSAHTAIDEHARKMLRRAIREKLLITIAATLCGAGLITGWSLWGLGDVSYYSGLVCVLLAVVWGIQYAVLTGRLIVRRGRSHASSGRRPSDEAGNEPPPEDGPTTADTAPAVSRGTPSA